MFGAIAPSHNEGNGQTPVAARKEPLCAAQSPQSLTLLTLWGIHSLSQI